MKMFDLKETVNLLNSPNIISLLSSIELYKGKTSKVSNLKKLELLTEIARYNTVVASNEVGNVYVDPDRAKKLLEKTTKPETFEEYMMVGYSNAIDLINDVYTKNVDTTVSEMMLKLYSNGIYDISTLCCTTVLCFHLASVIIKFKLLNA